jgi:hypothetical protein
MKYTIRQWMPAIVMIMFLVLAVTLLMNIMIALRTPQKTVTESQKIQWPSRPITQPIRTYQSPAKPEYRTTTEETAAGENTDI